MKLKPFNLCLMAAFTGAAISCSLPAHAQTAAAPATAAAATAGRLSVVELRDASLADALELIFKSAGNPSHIIDESAQYVPIARVTLTNIAWDGAMRNLVRLYNWKVSRNESGTWIIEPRAPVVAPGGFGEGGSPFGMPGGIPGGMPGGMTNPFMGGAGAGRGGKGAMGRGGMMSASQVSPHLAPTSAPLNTETQANAQTRGNFGGGRGNAATSTEGKDYKIIIVRHIYAGGIAQLFMKSTVISTESFVSPGVLEGGGSGGGGGFGGGGGGRGGGGGGFGGGGGGFGGGGGGFGGGGLGGGGGGFGGGGFGGGGLGGGGGGGFGGGFGF